MMNDTTVITLFILFGTCFGFVTYSQRHLFSEGPHKAKTSDDNPFESRIFWVRTLRFALANHGCHQNP